MIETQSSTRQAPRHDLLTVILAAGLLFWTAACDPGSAPAQDSSTVQQLQGSGAQTQTDKHETPDYKNGPLAKLGQDLTDLYLAYQDYKQAHGGSAAGFQPADSTLTITDDMVTISAVAAGVPADLKQDLEAAGMVNAAMAGRLVAGTVPIEALGSIAGFESLQFARPSRAY